MSQDIQLRKTLLIVKSGKSSLIQVENFLTNREWRIKTTSSLKEALLYVVSHKPQFVMIPVDHPHPKMKVLPKILQQAFPICVIVYAEVSNSVNYRAVLQSKCEYKHFPPATGPGVERIVNKYLKDMATQNSKVEETKKVAKAEGKNLSDEEALIAVKNKDKAREKAKARAAGAPEEVEEEVDDDPQLNSLLSQIMASKAGPAATGAGSIDALADDDIADVPSFLKSNNEAPVNFENEDDSFGTVDFSEKKKKNGSDADFSNPSYNESDIEKNNRQNWDAGNSGSSDGNSSGIGYMGGTGEGPAAKKKASGFIGSGEASSQDESGFGYMGGAGDDTAVRSTKRTSEGGFVPGTHDASDEEFGEFVGGAYDENDESKGALYKKKRAIRGGRSTDKDDGSIISAGTRDAIESSVIKGDGVVQEELQESSNVACIMIESTKFSGYLVAALGKDKKIDQSFIKMIQDKLFKFLQGQGEAVSNDESLNIKIKQVDFEDWALDYADFLRKSVHNGDEVAMAFFPRTEVKVKIEASRKAEMVSIGIDEFQSGVTVDFNMYIYLPANDKYVLYTPRGGSLAEDQKSRLIGKGVTHFHMYKEDVHDLNKYRAQNYLNGMIQEYETKAANESAKNSTEVDASDKNAQDASKMTAPKNKAS